MLDAHRFRPFDVHAHTGTDIDGSERTSIEHLEDLERIDGRSAIFPLCVDAGYAAENLRVIEECRQHPDRLFPFARFNPHTDSAREAARAVELGARGFKLHPRGEAFLLDHPNVSAILGVASEARLPTVIHAGRGVGSFGPIVVELAARHRGCPIILAHAGISDLAWLWRVMPEHPNIFFDTAWWNPADLVALFSLVPPSRVLHGSDAPYGDVELNLLVTLRCGLAAGLSTEQLDLVLGGQLERVLNGMGPVDCGPAAPAAIERSVSAARVSTFLAAAGGCLLGGGNPTEMLALGRLAVDPAAEDPDERLVAELIELIDLSCPKDTTNALVMALTISATSGVRLPTVSVRQRTRQLVPA